MGIRLGGLLVVLSLFFGDFQSTGADILGLPERAFAMARSPGADVGTQGRTVVLATILTCTVGANVNAYLQKSGSQFDPRELATTDVTCTGSTMPVQVTGRDGTLALSLPSAHHPPWWRSLRGLA
jgi:hypothetical protein